MTQFYLSLFKACCNEKKMKNTKIGYEFFNYEGT